MAIPIRTHPNLVHGFSNQINISTSLYNVMLDTMRTREEIERSWFSISRDIEIDYEQERERLNRNNVK